MAYFLPHLIPGGGKMISQLVCSDSAKVSAFVVVCGGGCRCRRRHIVNAFVTVFFTLECSDV
jgi:hypothetical protein